MSIYITSKCDAFKLGIYQRGCVATVELVDPYMEVRPADITKMSTLPTIMNAIIQRQCRSGMNLCARARERCRVNQAIENNITE